MANKIVGKSEHLVKKVYKKNKIATICIVLIVIAAIIAIVGSFTKSTVTPGSYQVSLFPPYGKFIIPLTRPGGWNENNGWDTAAQAKADNASSIAATPAVIRLNSSQIKMYVRIKNTGKTSSSMLKCKVQATGSVKSKATHNKTQVYSGTNYIYPTPFIGRAIQPGQYGSAVDVLTIPNKGAVYIQHITVSC